MRIIKIRNGFIRLENPLFGDNLFVGVSGLSITSNLIDIETDCLLKYEGKIVNIKQGKYTTEELNKIVSPLKISIKGDKINIKSNVYFKLDEKLNKYLGISSEKDKYFNTMRNTLVGDFPLKFTIPTSEDNLIQINQECKFIIGRNGHIPTTTLAVGLYSLKSLEKIFNNYSEKSTNKSTIVELEDGRLKISSPFNLGFDPYLSSCLGFEYKLTDIDVTNYSTIFPYRWPEESDIKTGKTFYTKTAEKIPNFNKEKYLTNIGGNIYFDSGLVTNVYRSNYTIEQLNNILKINVKVSDNNLIEINSSENSFILDNSLCESLGINFVPFSKIGNYSTSKLSNIPLELHCNIVEKSISNHKENNNVHYEEDLLFIFNSAQDNSFIKPSTITYIPVNEKKIQNIRLNIFDLEGNIFNKFTEFIVYLSLINR